MMKFLQLQLTKLNYSTIFFLSIFNESDTAPPSIEAHTPLEDVIGDLICQESDVLKILLSLNTNKACGPEGVTARLLREASSSIVPSLTRLCNSSLALGKLPCEWKNANVSPIFKKGDKELVCNYRPISLTCLLVKDLEKLVASHISFFQFKKFTQRSPVWFSKRFIMHLTVNTSFSLVGLGFGFWKTN